MYPQSLQTHSPCQYFESTSSSFCACDFLFPKTFKLVEDGPDTVETTAEGLTEKAEVVVRQMIAKMREARKDFMMNLFGGKRLVGVSV